MDPELLAALKTLTDATRLRIVGALAADPATPEALAGRLALPLSVVVRQLGLLHRHGLVAATKSAAVSGVTYSLRLDTLQSIGRRLTDLEGAAPTEVDESLSRDDAKILRAFIVDGRLESIPAQEKKRAVVLRYLLDACFAEDRAHPEKEVNQRLALFHPDVAALRRYLVDSKLMTRAAGEYRRAAE